MYVGLFFDSLFCSIDQPSHSLTNGSFTILKLSSVSSLTLFLFGIVLPILGLLHFYLNFRFTLLICTKLIGVFIEIAQIRLVRTDILSILSLPIHKHRICLHLFTCSLIFFHQSFIVFLIQLLCIFCYIYIQAYLSFFVPIINCTVLNF